MFDMIFGISVMALWSWSDWKHGRVNNLLLTLPCLILPLINSVNFLIYFMPVFAVLFVIHKKIRWKIDKSDDLLPMADVISIPFIFFFISFFSKLSMVGYPLAMIIKFYVRKDRIKLIPILFFGFSLSVVIELLLRIVA